VLTECVLKRAGTPLEIDRMAFWLVHSGNLRRLWFRHAEQLPIESDFSYGYGMARNMTQSEIREYGHEGKIHFPKIDSNYSSDEAALDYVKTTIDRALERIQDDEEKENF
jgi:hypothetical protein